MSVLFEISTFKLAKISSKILDTKKKNFFVELCYLFQYYYNFHIIYLFQDYINISFVIASCCP